MATTLASDFKLSDPVMQSGYVETLTQATDAFNGSSAGTIVMEAPQNKTGHYEREAFFKALTNGAVTRRDITSVSAVTPVKVEQTEIIRVKLNRKVGPIDLTLDAIRKIGSTVESISFAIGQQVAKAQLVEGLNSSLAALAAAIQNVGATMTYDGTASTLTHTNLVNGNALLGDRAGDIKCYVMHSKVYHDLMKQAIADKVTEVAGVTIMAGTVATLGRPVVVTDSASLLIDETTDKYLTLGLTPGAASLQMTEAMSLVNQLVTGNENLIQRFQGEYAMNLGLKGFTWDATNGGANPDATALGTGTNWDKVMQSIKDCAGVCIKSL
jgi:hypothetical protein